MIVEYSVLSKHLTSKVIHELLFSIRRKKYIKPALSDKYSGRLTYKLLPGRYIKFSLHTLKNSDYAKFVISYVDIDKNGNVSEKMIYEIEMSYNAFMEIAIELGVPYVLKEFVRMVPEFHKISKVDESNYPEDKDVQQIIDEIKQYLEKKVVSQ